MSTNNKNLMKTLKTINNVISESPIKNNPNNSSKKSKKYSQRIETHYYETRNPQTVIKSNKNLERKENLFRLFQKKILFRKWLYRLRLNLTKLKNSQNKKKPIKGLQKQLYDYQFVCYSDQFRVPPKNSVDRMRRILPNFEFNHIEEARRDKYDIKLLWPVNNILFPPKEKGKRIHKIPTTGRSEYLDQVASMNRLSVPKPDHSYENNIYNNYYKQRKISQKEALELCQRLNFKPSQKHNYDYIEDYYNLYDYENEKKKRKSSTTHKKNKKSSFSQDSNVRIDLEQDKNLSNLTQELAQNKGSRTNSSDDKFNLDDNTSNNMINDNNTENVIKNSFNKYTSKTNHSSQEKILSTNNQNSNNSYSHVNKYNNNHSYSLNTEENTEIVSDLLDTSENQIKRKNDSNVIIIEEEEEDIEEKPTSNKVKNSLNYFTKNKLSEEESYPERFNYSKNSLNGSSHKLSGEEEEYYYSKITNNTQAKSGTNLHKNIINNEEEEEEIFSSKINSNNQATSSSNYLQNLIKDEKEEIYNNKIINSSQVKSSSNHFQNTLNEEEEEVYNSKITNNSQLKSSSNYLQNLINDDEEEIYNNKITNSSQAKSSSNYLQNLINDEEEEIISSKIINSNHTQSSSNHLQNTLNEEEEEIYNGKITDNSHEIGNSNYLQNLINDEEEEIVNNGSKSKSSSNNNILNLTSDEEEEVYNNIAAKYNQSHQSVKSEEEEINNAKLNTSNNTNPTISNSYPNIDIFEEEDIDNFDISKGARITKVVNDNINTQINEEEEDFMITSNTNIVRKTSSKVTRTSITNKTVSKQESPVITHEFRQFTQTISKQNDNVNDELFSASSVDNGILIGSTSSGIGPDLQNNGYIDQDVNHHMSESSDSFA